MADSEDSDGQSRRDTWRDRYPWLLLLRSFRISVGLQVLLLAGLAAVATSAGWRLAASTITSDAGEAGATVAADREYLSKWPGQRTMPGFPESVPLPESVQGQLSATLSAAPSNPVVALPIRLALPLVRMFDRRLTWGQFLFYVIGGFWTLLVWSAAGTAISRVALVQLGREDRIELISAMRFAQSRVPSVLGATMMPIFGTAMLTIPIALIGLLMHTGIGALMAGLLWPIVIVITGMMAMMLLGMLFGWPLVNVALAAEGSDAFDGVSRSYAYTFQRPLRYLAYCVVSALVGILGWLLVWGFSEVVIGLGFWSATWGLGRDGVSLVATSSAELTGLTWLGAQLIRFWIAAARTLASGYGYSFFWSAMGGVYLLLRQDVDSTEWDEVYDERRQGGVVYGLPQTDVSGDGAEASASSESA